MEKVLTLAAHLLGVWFSLVFLLIVLPSLFGVSLGISELYLKALVKTWERCLQSPANEYRCRVVDLIDAEGHTLAVKLIFCKQKDCGTGHGLQGKKKKERERESGRCWKRLQVQDMTVRVDTTWLETEFSHSCLGYHCWGCNFNDDSGMTCLMLCKRGLPVFLFNRAKDWLSDLVHLTCSRILVRALSGNIYYHNKENKPQKGGICVANHTSPIDVIILTNDGCYAMVGQSHGGLMGVIQRATVKASPHVWFERSEMKDRHLVTRRLKEHIANKDKLPILIFPEGTCINNTSVMMFKKGSFEIGGTIYPVAIKEGEDAVHFANRVKSAIARQGGLTELPWDGGLKRAKVKETFKEEEQKNYSKMIIGNGAMSSSAVDSD
ncbi:hypothetical protein JRQ81_016933 [Phrynocephalus forsythii]|uniref:Phospholipid/glycerol acyltransferase domain-containing protein n=1 Tax=Phrynocephalus forsythii TaxID=171643 RepID=A0A9Q1B118_9SAUR|nr:hypothetical protein JRQ81_016933 [Phrynocephalus forsythii]